MPWGLRQGQVPSAGGGRKVRSYRNRNLSQAGLQRLGERPGACGCSRKKAQCEQRHGGRAGGSLDTQGPGKAGTWGSRGGGSNTVRGHRAGQGGGGPGRDLRINLASRKRFQFNEEEGTERRGKLASSRGGGMRRLCTSNSEWQAAQPAAPKSSKLEKQLNFI